jgi:hypothetical protein
MVSSDITPENVEERLIWYAITGTYAFYALGALYIVGPMLAWMLGLRLLTHYVWPAFIGRVPLRVHIPVAIWLWLLGMLVMLLSLVVAHLQFELGTGLLIKSTLGWAKGWALLGLFPLLGCLPIRPRVIYRAGLVVCCHTLLLLPVFVGSYLVRLPSNLYVSPLQILGGPGPEFFTLNLYDNTSDTFC